MHLKRIEVENFKSFGRKLTIPFLEGFTAITGPNGSGKSNIGDAILFVLGPKSSKAIRAGKLTDLIFNGGKDGHAAKSCKVTLVFDNSDRLIPVDEDEVALTRLVRLSKTNPDNYYSYYYVNGESSTAGEFDELLAHARISADGYNITQQGDVTRIVEMSNVDRRRLVDDMSGITQFDNDIDKANEEREEVEANLERIQIILDEIDRQLKTLEKEKEDAERYQRIKVELDVEKAKLAKKRKQGLQKELAGVQGQMAEYEEERQSLLERLEELKGDAREAEGELQRIEEEIANRGGEEAKALKAKIDALKQEMVRSTERINYSRHEIQELKRERAEAQEDLRRVDKELEKARERQDELADAKADADAALQEKVQELEDLRNQLSQSTGRASELQRELAKAKQDHERTADALHEARLNQDRLGEKRERLRAQLAEAEEQLETAQFEIKDIDWELKELQKAVKGDKASTQELEKELFEAKKKESEISKQLRELEPAIRRLQNQYSQAKMEQEASEKYARGYTRAVDAVIEARDRGMLDGICGTVAELATVDSKYETALEIAAGGRLQAVVTETDEDAARAIEFLKKQKVGRATFLPLSKLSTRRPGGKALMAVRDPKAEGFAIDLVNFEEKYKPAFWYVLRDTVIVQDMNAARKLMGGVRLVTLDGDLVDAGGAMTGGVSGRRNKLKFGASSKEELERIGKELRAATAHQEALSGELVEVRDRIHEIEGELRSEGQDSADKERRIQELERARKEYAAKTEAFEEARDERVQALEAAEAALAEGDAEVQRLQQRLDDLEATREEKGKLLLKATSESVRQKLQSLEAAVADLREAARDAASRVATEAQKLDLIQERRGEVAAKVEAIDAEQSDHEDAIAEHEEKLEGLQEELDVLLEVEAEQDEELKELHDARDRAYERKVELQNSLGKVSDKIDTTADLIVGLKTRIPVLEEQLAEVSFELTGYDVDVPDEIPESQDALRSTVRSLEQQLERLGNVNMRAIEEWERQSERKAELVEEFAHLEEQRENLVALVDEIVAKKKDRFFKVFHEINQNFQSVFARLSDGGKARLELEHPDDPFEGGLIMKSQPKGKKVTRLEALSGGEKSLTSMAFIFAIQEYEPSPFYYLDEVDQNLDGVNSELLARMVKANSQTCQVIMVSLRKVTLKEADHVYGVTMMDSGISDVVGEVNIAEIVEPDDSPPAEVSA